MDIAFLFFRFLFCRIIWSSKRPNPESSTKTNIPSYDSNKNGGEFLHLRSVPGRLNKKKKPILSPQTKCPGKTQTPSQNTEHGESHVMEFS